MKKSAFIDLDGTLLDSEAIYQRFWKVALKLAGYDPDKADTLKLRSADHEAAKAYLSSVYGPNVDVDEIRNIRKREMNEWLLTHEYKLKPGVKEGLQYLNDKGIACYIVSATAKSTILELLQKYGIRDYFRDVLSAKDVKRGKPNPDVYLKALELSKINASEAIAIEDAPNGIVAAYRAGIDVYMVPDLSPNNKETRAYVKGVLKDLSDIRNFI